jgi:PAS domain S-box-containing protein
MTGTPPETIHILHVDDEPNLADTVAMFLQKEDDRFVVETATSASIGRERLVDGDFDCIVSDYEMPRENGIEFLDAIRDEHPDLPFILYTGKGSEEVASKAFSKGATDYLQKESGTDQYTLLANKITNYVDKYRAERTMRRRARAMEIANEGIALVDDNGRYIEVNNSYAELYGTDADSLIGSHWTVTVPDDEVERLQTEAFSHALEHGSWTGEAQGQRVDGSTYPKLLSLAPFDDGGHVCIVRDITEIKKREERLEQTTSRLEALFESSPDMVEIHTTDGTIIDVNQQFCEAFNQPKDELVGQKVWETDQEIEPEELQEIWDGMDVGDRTKFETEFRAKNGTRFPVEVHITRLPVDDGTRFMIISRDITERKQRMQEIRTLKERLELAVEGANLGVWDWNLTTDEVKFNDQWAEMLDYTLEDLEPHLRAWENRVHPDDIEEVKAALDEHIQQETDYYDTEHRMRTADGKWKWIRDLGKIVERDSNDDPIRAVGIHLDIDESKQYQRELEQKTEELEELTTRLEDQYQTLFEEAPVMAVVTRAENGRPIIEDCNNQFAETLGFEPETLIGTDLAEFYTPDSREALIEGNGYKRALKGEFTTESRELIAADNTVVETLLRAVQRKDTAGEVVGTLAMYIDITEREEAKRANERLEEFASIVSHDLRNPLNVLIGAIDMVEETGDLDHLTRAHRALDRMETLIDDLLTLSRSGDIIGATEVIDLASFSENCWENVSTADATLTIETDQRLKADRTRLKQLLENLFRNAIEHGGETVTIRMGDLREGFYVEDNGPGIPEDDRQTVFESGYSTTSGGTGFGLAIVMEVANAHGWDVDVTDSSDGGARFEFTGTLDNHTDQ